MIASEIVCFFSNFWFVERTCRCVATGESPTHRWEDEPVGREEVEREQRRVEREQRRVEREHRRVEREQRRAEREQRRAEREQRRAGWQQGTCD